MIWLKTSNEIWLDVMIWLKTSNEIWLDVMIWLKTSNKISLDVMIWLKTSNKIWLDVMTIWLNQYCQTDLYTWKQDVKINSHFINNYSTYVGKTTNIAMGVGLWLQNNVVFRSWTYMFFIYDYFYYLKTIFF